MAFCTKHCICSFQCGQIKILYTQKEQKHLSNYYFFFLNVLKLSAVDTKWNPRDRTETSICFVAPNTDTVQDLFGFFVVKK